MTPITNTATQGTTTLPSTSGLDLPLSRHENLGFALKCSDPRGPVLPSRTPCPKDTASKAVGNTSRKSSNVESVVRHTFSFSVPSGSATPAVSDGTGDKPRTLPFSRTTGSVWTTRTRQRRCRDVPPKVLIFERLPSQRRGEPRALLTSRVARSRLALIPEAVACKERSAQGQTLLAGDQLDSWPGLVCPGTRIDKSINESVGCRGPHRDTLPALREMASTRNCWM